MNWLEPVLDRWQIDTSFACRRGKGVHAAVRYAQRQCRRAAIVVKLDISGYFEHIDHVVLRAQLRRRVKGAGVLRLIDAILASYCSAPGKGLPIGALCSQHFANTYLTPADRYAMLQPETVAHCRIMDDTLLWCCSLADARRLVRGYRQFAAETLSLQIKKPVIQRVVHGISFCGYRIYPHQLKPGRRRLRNARKRREYWERQWLDGRIDSATLQRNTDAVSAIVLPASLPHHAYQAQQSLVHEA